MLAIRFYLAVALLLTPTASVSAHSFGQTYILPVPIWLYLYGSAAALLASFVVVSYFARSGNSGKSGKKNILVTIDVNQVRWWPWTLRVLRSGSVCCLLLTLITGFIGINDAYRNINMTLFWVIFVLGFTYLTAIIGDVYSAINPWKVLVEWIEHVCPNMFSGKVDYPKRWEYWPALLLYFVFIWIELFAGSKPRTLSLMLLSYTLLNLSGSWIFGKGYWFKYVEFFGIFLRLIAKIAPFHYQHSTRMNSAKLLIRWPCSGLSENPPKQLSLLLFLLFMLSSTAFDGIKSTSAWVEFFWVDLYQAALVPLLGGEFYNTYPMISKIYLGYQTLALALSPLVYLGIYCFFLWLAKIITGNREPLIKLALAFSFTLMPIVFVYHLSHYYTLLITQGSQIVRLLSNPFGIGWNVFGTAAWTINPIPNMWIIWNSQVFLILLGHITSVYLAHIQALRSFGNHRMAIRSQYPMLILMLAFTVAGLWILALPANSGSPVG